MGNRLDGGNKPAHDERKRISQLSYVFRYMSPHACLDVSLAAGRALGVACSFPSPDGRRAASTPPVSLASPGSASPRGCDRGKSMCQACESGRSVHAAQPSRRSFLKSLGAAAAVVALTGPAFAAEVKAPPKPENVVSPDGA